MRHAAGRPCGLRLRRTGVCPDSRMWRRPAHGAVCVSGGGSVMVVGLVVGWARLNGGRVAGSDTYSVAGL